MTWFLSLIGLALPGYLIRFSIFGIPTTLLEIFIYLGLIIILTVKPLAEVGEKLKPIIKQIGWPILLLLVGGLIATLIAPDMRVALGLFKAYLLDPIIMSVIVITLVDTREKLNRLLLGLIGGGAAVAISAILGERTIDGRTLGLYAYDPDASPNFIALFLAPIATLTLGLIHAKKPPLTKKQLLGAIILMVTAIILAGSRGGLLGLFVGVGLLSIWQMAQNLGNFTRWLTPTICLFIAICLAVGGWLSRPDFGPNPSMRAATSNNLRYEIWRTTIVDILPAKPVFGVGLGNFQPYFTNLTKDRVNFPQYIAPWALTPHNIFLTIWTNLGLLGLIGFVWLLVIFFKTNRWFPLSAAMLALLAHGLVDSAYWKNDLALLFWLLLIMGFIAKHFEKRPHETA